MSEKMTNEQAIRWLHVAKGYVGGIGIVKAIDMAITALSEEPCEDAILQKICDEIDAHREKRKTMADDDWYAGKIRGYDCAIEIIDRYKKP